MTPQGLAALKTQLEQEEALMTVAYPDPDSPLAKECTRLGLPLRLYMKVPNWPALSGAPWSIAYGHTGPEVRPGMTVTPAQAEQILADDVAKIEALLSKYEPWWSTLPDPQADVMVDIAFNIGVAGIMKWPRFLGFLKAGEYEQAANELAGTHPWIDQVKTRGQRLVAQLRQGEHLPANWAATQTREAMS